MKKSSNQLVYSPSDLVTYVKSPFASWMDRYNVEYPGSIKPDEKTPDQKLIAETGDKHEQMMLEEFKTSFSNLKEILTKEIEVGRVETIAAIREKVPIIFQAALLNGTFAGFADFLILNAYNEYEVWDTKLANAPRPYFAIQLCCYSEMLAAMTSNRMPVKFGIILGNKERVEFRVEDFIHYYNRVKTSFLEMQNNFTGKFVDRPEPLPRADHNRWTSHAEKYFDETDHLVRVAGITVGQIKKLKAAGITTMDSLSKASKKPINKLAADSLEKLVAQARLQCLTREDRRKDAGALARYEVLPQVGINNERIGLASLPQANPSDVFFDMEGYPLVSGGLEYLFGVSFGYDQNGSYEFKDWWAHNRAEEKIAFENFIDWAFKRWESNRDMHIYHYAAYEVSAIRRLSTRHDTRQDEVDNLLRNRVFVDLYQVVRQGLRIGDSSYSIKAVEQLYRPKRSTEVTTAVDSIVQYARWIENREPEDWKKSAILKDIRAYNEDDCKSTSELLLWLRKLAAENNINFVTPAGVEIQLNTTTKEISPEVIARLDAISNLRKQDDSISIVLADILDFHRREEKPMWWRMFDRADASLDELRDDAGCIQGIKATGVASTEKRSLVQHYEFDPIQECKLAAGDKTNVMFTHNLEAKLTLSALDLVKGNLQIKISQKGLNDKFGGTFPSHGSLIPYEFVPAGSIQTALTEIAGKYLSKVFHAPIMALLNRKAPVVTVQEMNENAVSAAIRISGLMSGDCLVIQGPPGTGKTYTASHVIKSLLAAGKKVGVASNSHKAVVNLILACGEAVKETGETLTGVKVGGPNEGDLFSSNPNFKYVESNNDAHSTYKGGVIGGTAWLFTRPEWEGALDFLFIDEAGQVPLANAIAMARCAQNLVLLGDQMQLEQPIQGTHPGDAGLSSLQYALKDLKASRPDAPVFHAVIPSDYGLFLGESRRMHPSVCRFISESIYEARLKSHPDCENQKIEVPQEINGIIRKENGVVFVGVEHDGDIQQSDDEVEKVKAIYKEMLGRQYTAAEGTTRKLSLDDFLFIAPYNAQVRALQAALPDGAKVGSVDKFQGREAPICILSLCSSYGEYGSRGLGFILDRNRINVAISRAQCIAIVVADPRIASSEAGSMNEMMLLNLFCKLAN